MEKNPKTFIGLNSKKVANKKGSRSYASGISIACSSAIRQHNEYGAKINEDDDAVKMNFAVHDCQGNECQPMCNVCAMKASLSNPNSNEWTALEVKDAADTVLPWPTFASIDIRIKNRYPSLSGKNIKYQLLRVTVNDHIWLQTYIKTIPLSTLIRSTSPSGYKNQGRISVGAKLALQGQSNTDLVMVIQKDPNYKDDDFETKEPVVNTVGFWGLASTSDGDDDDDSKETGDSDVDNTPYIIQLHQSHIRNTCFGFYARSNTNNILSISVDFVAVDKGRPQIPINIFEWTAPGGARVDVEVENSSPSGGDSPTSPTDTSSSSTGSNHSLRVRDLSESPVARPFQSVPQLNGYRSEMQQQHSNDRRRYRQHAVAVRHHPNQHIDHHHHHNDNHVGSVRNNQAQQPQMSNQLIGEIRAMQDQLALFTRKQAEMSQQHAEMSQQQAQMSQQQSEISGQLAELIGHVQAQTRMNYSCSQHNCDHDAYQVQANGVSSSSYPVQPVQMGYPHGHVSALSPPPQHAQMPTQSQLPPAIQPPNGLQMEYGSVPPPFPPFFGNQHDNTSEYSQLLTFARPEMSYDGHY